LNSLHYIIIFHWQEKGRAMLIITADI